MIAERGRLYYNSQPHFEQTLSTKGVSCSHLLVALVLHMCYNLFVKYIDVLEVVYIHGGSYAMCRHFLMFLKLYKILPALLKVAVAQARVRTRPEASTSNRRGGGRIRGRGGGSSGGESVSSLLCSKCRLMGSWCVGEGGPLCKVRPGPSRPRTGLVCRWVGSLPLSGSRPIICRESSEWACLIVSINRLNRVPSLSSRKSVHVQRPRLYGSPRLLPPAPPTASLTTRNLEQPAPCPEVS